MTQWCVANSEILDLKADVLICSANPNLNLSGGVGGAFLLRYGPEMQAYLHHFLRANSRRYIEPGNAVLTPPCGSPFVAVAHAVAIDAFYDTNATQIRRAYADALHQLELASCRRIVAACLGCGYGRCPIIEFTKAILELVALPFPGVENVTLASTNSELTDAIATALAAR